MPGRVHGRRQFALFSSPTRRSQSGPLRVSYVADQSEEGSISVAYAISRKVGNAVVRNKVRRRLRALIDDLEPPPSPGLYLIRCGIETGSLSYEQLHHHIQRAFSRVRGD